MEAKQLLAESCAKVDILEMKKALIPNPSAEEDAVAVIPLAGICIYM